MSRLARYALFVVVGLGTVTGCYTPDSNRVPWWRGVPASLLSHNSLEAEVWRQQRTGYVEGWPVPSKPVVGPLTPNDAGIAPRSNTEMEETDE